MNNENTDIVTGKQHNARFHRGKSQGVSGIGASPTF